MKISELASISQVSAETIRYYEKIGLISKASRGENGYRYYQSKDTETLVFIRRCRELNISLEDIRLLVDAQKTPKASCELVDQTIEKQLKRIRQTQQELALLEQSLAHLLSSCSSNQIEHCTILQRLKIGDIEKR